MFHPKLRRVLASTVLVSALSLLPVRNAGAEPRGRWNTAFNTASNTAFNHEGGGVAERIALRPASFWDLVMRFLAKASVRIDPDGNKASVRIDPDGNS
jgi:hypothetical protein